MEIKDIIEKAKIIPSLTSEMERTCLAELAAQVAANGLIVEVGTLYGGATAVLALAAPSAKVLTIDDFAWYPQDWGFGPTSKELLFENMETLEVVNVNVWQGDSRSLGKTWDGKIDLLWIDGGHSYEFVHTDLENFGRHAEVIALHDWDNPAWPDIRQAVEKFMADHAEWRIDAVVGMVVVLRKS